MVLVVCRLFLFSQPQFSESIVWQKNETPGIAHFFVYGLAVANDNSILAFAEARIKPGDDSPHHLALKRSLDGGRTWLPTQYLMKSENGTCYGNPTPVVDTKTGNIILVYAVNYQNDSSDIFYIISKDNGQSWNEPIKITHLFNNDPMHRTFHLPGPGHGIALSSGRLLVPVWHRYSIRQNASARKYGVSVIYSDDHGQSWQAGGYMPYSENFPVNESRLVELEPGKILLDSRPLHGNNKTMLAKRIESISKDDGISWSAPFYSSVKSFPVVDAGLNKLRWKGRTYLVFSNPLGPGRRNLAVHLSKNKGKNWAWTKLVHEGPATYSDVAVLADGSILILYGTGADEEVRLAKCNIPWIKTP